MSNQKQQHTQEPTRCAICGTLIDPDLGWSQLPPPDPDLPGKQKSWTPNMSLEFHREWTAVGPQLQEQAYWFGEDARGIVDAIHRFVANPHQQDLFGDRLCNLRDGSHHLLNRLQALTAMLERLNLEKRYESPTVLARPLAPTGWRSWTRTLLPL